MTKPECGEDRQRFLDRQAAGGFNVGRAGGALVALMGLSDVGTARSSQSAVSFVDVRIAVDTTDFAMQTKWSL